MRLRTLCMAVGCAAITALLPATAQTTYKNPIIAEDAPDPSIIKGNDGYYYLLSTAEHVYRSTDLVNWEYLRQAFGNNPRPQFVEGVDVYWAPCVTKQDGRYVLYFALSTWGGGQTASIGVATSDKPGGPFKLVGDGKLFTSGEVGVENSIDPNYIEEDGHKYVVWGSWNGIWLIELTADGLAVKDITKKTQIAGTKFEAPYIYKRGKFYYLFCSIGACCEGERSTYETVVGRASKLTGPYYDKNGNRLLDNNCSIVLTSNSPCIAPGHNSRIFEDEAGRTWITYHGYMRSNPDKGRVVWLDEVKWRNSWPYVAGNGASDKELEAPTVTPFSLDLGENKPEWGVEQGTLLPVDLKADGQKSLIVAGQKTDNSGIPTPWSAIIQRNAEGTWDAVQGGLQTGLTPTIVPAELDGDGQLEIIIFGTPHETTNPNGTANGIYKVDDKGVLQQTEATIIGTSFAELTAGTAADVNCDGRTDIIAVGPDGRKFVLLASDTEADTKFRFKSHDFDTSAATFSQVYAYDFNGDGAVDLFACSADAAELYLNDGLGRFTPTGWTTTNPLPADGGVAVADVNHDSALDIVLAGATCAVCLNDGTGHFTPSTDTKLTLDYQNQSFSTAAANLFDWDGDGFADFLYQGDSPALAITTGSIWLGSSKGIFYQHRRFASGSAAATTFLDWDGDGSPDIISAGRSTDSHFFPLATGNVFAVTPNPTSASRKLTKLINLESQVEGNRVQLTWSKGLKQQTYEVYVRDDQGRLYGNVRSYVDGDFNGQRKVLDHGNNGTATTATFFLPKGHYTWGVQRLNARLEGSPFATGEFTILTDDITDFPASSAVSPTAPVRYNVLGQPATPQQKGIQLLHYPDGSVHKTLSK